MTDNKRLDFSAREMSSADVLILLLVYHLDSTCIARLTGDEHARTQNGNQNKNNRTERYLCSVFCSSVPPIRNKPTRVQTLPATWPQRWREGGQREVGNLNCTPRESGRTRGPRRPGTTAIRHKRRSKPCPPMATGASPRTSRGTAPSRAETRTPTARKGAKA